jgi:SAM-dependent methyltransferase
VPVTEQQFDATVPNVARVYDYLLGGKDHFAADREFAAKLMAVRGDTQMTVRENRAFLGRMVTWLAEAGVRQFLDLGTGLPTSDNVHQVAQRIDPAARIVYVDNDPTVVVHAKALLAHPSKNVAVVHADLRDPGAVLGAAETRELIDWDQPVAILMLAILHFVPDADLPHDVVARYTDRLPAGGYLALSHAELRTGVDEIAKQYTAQASAAAQARTAEEIRAFFTGLELVEPGLVPVSEWRPATLGGHAESWFLGGAAIKRAGVRRSAG